MTPRQRRKHPWRTPPLPLTLSASSTRKRILSANGHTATAVSAHHSGATMKLPFSLIFAASFLVAVVVLLRSSPLDALIWKPVGLSQRNAHSWLSDGRGRGRGAQSFVRYANLAEIQSSSRLYDVVVIGCGPAGLTAALFASRMGLSVLVVGSPSAGSLSGTSRLDNFPAFLVGGGGQGWVDAATEQAARFGAEFAPPTATATGLASAKPRGRAAFGVRLGAAGAPPAEALARTVVVASGSVPRRLGLPLESSLWGRSLHNCALCDGDAYAPHEGVGKSVAVVGGGDAAVDAIFLLHDLGVDIHWVHRREEYKASPSDVESIRRLSGVEIWSPYVVVEWMVKEAGDAWTGGDPPPPALGGMRIAGAKEGEADPDASSSLMIPCDGAFLMIGSDPNSEWLLGSGVDVDPVTKLIRLVPSPDSASDVGGGDPPLRFSTSTSVGGVFAAGEVADGTYRQALTASSEGAKAAIDAQRYLRHAEGAGVVPIGRTASNDRWKGPREAAPDHPVRGVAHAGPEACDMANLKCIERVISTSPLVVFSKSYCPHCRRALEALRETGAEPLVIELSDMGMNAPKVQDALASLTGRRTVPNVFVGSKSIGGGDETVALHREGKLGGLLREAGAIP